MSDKYGFTTNLEDNFLPRIAEEAGKDTNFIIVSGKNTVTQERFLTAMGRVTTVRNLADINPELTLATIALGDIVLDLDDSIGNQASPDSAHVPGFFGLHFRGTSDMVESEIDVLRQEINRLNNVLNGDIIRVTVESF